jgi:hypothetical protein
MDANVCERVDVSVRPRAGRHHATQLWEMTHGPDCVELYEARHVRLTVEQVEALRQQGAVLMLLSDESIG